MEELSVSIPSLFFLCELGDSSVISVRTRSASGYAAVARRYGG